ncbi:Lrp/AsnC family transcriptional regulator [Brevibacterium album]|uniref:Lrp/AsnC family transcriptional regulator n=1 Tax=Brevibacterium album TaxID=417948 RepID=UPI0003F9E753|nr:Lrp/AsnC family transcriptional regulator [Brevibacterium album]
MDAVDEDIIRHLQRNARLTNTELADAVGLTPSPCLRRVRRLEEEGIIRGYHARVDEARLGRGTEVLVFVEMGLKTRDTAEAFESALAPFPEVIELRRMFGLPDYLVRIAVADLAEAERFIAGTLSALPGVARVDSHLTMKLVKGGG